MVPGTGVEHSALARMNARSAPFGFRFVPRFVPRFRSRYPARAAITAMVACYRIIPRTSAIDPASAAGSQAPQRLALPRSGLWWRRSWRRLKMACEPIGKVRKFAHRLNPTPPPCSTYHAGPCNTPEKCSTKRRPKWRRPSSVAIWQRQPVEVAALAVADIYRRDYQQYVGNTAFVVLRVGESYMPRITAA